VGEGESRGAILGSDAILD
jgi:hypothetical protein